MEDSSEGSLQAKGLNKKKHPFSQSWASVSKQIQVSIGMSQKDDNFFFLKKKKLTNSHYYKNTI